MRSSLASRTLWSALLVLASACAGPHPSIFATDPPGARVIIDGEDSGFVTPCAIDLPSDPHVIDFTLPGYASARRTTYPETQRYAILYREWISNTDTWRFPLWLNVEDLFVPIKTISTQSPQRIFVRLRPQADL